MTDFDTLHYNIDDRLGGGPPINWKDKNSIILVHKCQSGYLKYLPVMLCSLCRETTGDFRITIAEFERRNDEMKKNETTQINRDS